jgi:predicted  nucleic acid-binding Zn-ribbon protein
MVGSVHDNLQGQIRQLKDDLYEANKEMVHLREETNTANSRIQEKEIAISDLQEQVLLLKIFLDDACEPLKYYKYYKCFPVDTRKVLNNC